jgi:hypothetical protein
MAITGRPALWTDIEPGLSIPSARGDAAVCSQSALDGWKVVFENPFFLSAVLEARPAIAGREFLGIGLAVLVASGFADAEIESPRPDIASRVLASVRSGHSALLSWRDVARANAGAGVDLMILHSGWYDEILIPVQRHDVKTVLASGLVQSLAGFRIHRIIAETASEPVTKFHRESIEYRVVAEFPERGRTIFLMNRESGTCSPGSLGNVIFRVHEPVLRLRASDQQLLLAALSGATDAELGSILGVSCGAVKARWRSIFARIEKTMPELVSDEWSRDVRGLQKRHRVIAYVRDHPVEVRPYDWETEGRATRRLEGTTERI